MLIETRYEVRRLQGQSEHKENESPASSFDGHTETSRTEDSTPLRATKLMEAEYRSDRKKSDVGNVWYYYVVKPLVRENRRIPYKESFQDRVVRQVGIPVSQLQGIHELFIADYRHFSPLIGMIFAYNNYINNMYRYGDSAGDPAANLVRMLFHVLPGGEIQPTHAARNAAAHLTAGLVGAILEAWVPFRREPRGSSSQAHIDWEQRLATVFRHVISTHPDHEESRRDVEEQVQKASLELECLNLRDKDSAATRKEIKRIEGDIIKAHRHKIKRLEKELFSDTENTSQLQREIEQCEATIIQAEESVSDLRDRIVTSLDKKLARKALKRAEDAAALEVQSVTSLADALATAFCAYERGVVNVSVPSTHIVSAILQAYLWRKYGTIGALQPYFESMERLGALNTGCMTTLEQLGANEAFKKQTPLHGKYKRFVAPLRPRKQWPPSLVEKASTIVAAQSRTIDRPPIVPFSYITWAAYSEFPDCGETAIRNLLNQIVYNPETGRFDSDLLVKLRDRYYPQLSLSLLDFYRRHPRIQEVTNSQVALDWIETVTGLNRAREGQFEDSSRIRYRREKDEQNIASPLRNLLRVFNALFGIDRLDDYSRVEEVVHHVNILRGGNEMTADMSGVKQDGFGILGLAVGGVRYELQSYKPVHFGFLQVESAWSEANGRYEFGAFRKLMRYSSNSRLNLASHVASPLEELAIASMFVPYHLQRNHAGRYFRSAPDHIPLLFADLDGASSRKAALRWARSRRNTNTELSRLMNCIQNYKEPSFGPTKKSDS